MRTIIGVSLIVFGFTSVGLANLLHFKAESELLARRPELKKGLYFWMIFRKHDLVEESYKAEFPNGTRIWQFRLCAIAGVLGFVSGLIVLGFFK